MGWTNNGPSGVDIKTECRELLWAAVLLTMSPAVSKHFKCFGLLHYTHFDPLLLCNVSCVFLPALYVVSSLLSDTENFFRNSL